MAGRRIYLDHAATTPLRPEAARAMAHWLTGDNFGNPSSMHADGRAAKDAIDIAREQVSGALGCAFGEVVFTSGGTEAVNLAVVGSALAGVKRRRARVLFGASEHHAVLACEPLLAALGYVVEIVPTDRFGRIDLNALEDRLAADVLLVSAMFVNNEVGSWQPVREVARLAARHGALLHCDAVQAFGIPGPDGAAWTAAGLGADLVSVSAHKIGGPKGAGALYVRAGTPIQPIVCGGGQEREMRAGTESVAAIAGFGAAARWPSDATCRRRARDAFAAAARSAVRTLPGDIDAHPGILHVHVPGLSAETALIRLDRAGVSASSGAACSSGSLEPSHVLLACGFSPAEAKEGLRFSFGDATGVDEAVAAAGLLESIVDEVRSVRAR